MNIHKRLPVTDLDAVDLRILRELQINGRISNLELAKRVNLSATPCLARVKRMERQGVISGYAAFVAPDALDAAMLVFVEIVLDRTTEDVFELFREAVIAVPQIQECHMVSGGFDYLIKARVKDMADYRTFLGKSLVELPNVRETHTYVVMEEVKSTTAIAIPERLR
ncbi:MAG: Lrp/AsnC ligand binding domain-containing protein [Rhodospirillales bacterium]|nr:Lrp/AsnC ligand binding domain-containing protein [Rhodospirillales bacterium]